MAGKRMGRPPAPWVRKIEFLPIEDSQYLDAYDLSSQLQVPVGCLKSFFRKTNVRRKHEIYEDGQTYACFKVKDLKKAAREYLAPWA